MGKCPALIIFLASSLFLVFQNLEVVNAVGCAGNFINGNSSYVQNRKNLFSTLPDKVKANGQLYNASLGKIPDRVYALVLCPRGYEKNACIDCVERATKSIRAECSNRMDSFTWDQDGEENVSCLVRSSNHSTFGKLELTPPNIYPSPDGIEPSINKTLFEQQWDAMVNRTVEAATKANTSTVLKYYGALRAEFTEFPNVYMLMQCTPDITSQECKRCLRDCVRLYKNKYWGRQGGAVNRPSCLFRWDLYAFYNAFDKVPRSPAPPRPQAQDKKGKDN